MINRLGVLADHDMKLSKNEQSAVNNKPE